MEFAPLITKLVPVVAWAWKATPFTVTAPPPQFTATVYWEEPVIPESASPVHGAYVQLACARAVRAVKPSASAMIMLIRRACLFMPPPLDALSIPAIAHHPFLMFVKS
jgi:hypothetical protein